MSTYVSKYVAVYDNEQIYGASNHCHGVTHTGSNTYIEKQELIIIVAE
jgi:hypothetical protein